MLFSSCSANKKGNEVVTDGKKDDSYSTDDYVGRYLKIEKLYYYDSLLKLLQGNQESEDMGEFNVSYEKPVKLLSKSGESQRVFHKSGKCATYSDKSLGQPFAEISTKMNANPFSNLNLLVDKGWLVANEDRDIREENKKLNGIVFDFEDITKNTCNMYIEYNAPMFSVNKQYAYSEQGCKDYLRTVAALEKSNSNTLTFVASPKIDVFNVKYSKKDECYFSFIINYDSSNAYITALYFRSDDSKYITDVTAQVMCIAYPYDDFSAGVSISLSSLSAQEELGKMSFFMALEQALTGECLISEDTVIKDESDKKYVIPYEYEGKNHTAKISEKYYVTDLEYPHKTTDVTDFFDVYTYSVKLK